MVLPDTNIFAGMELRSTLANDDVAGSDKLSTEAFYTQSL
jgi:hypothetical protein